MPYVFVILLMLIPLPMNARAEHDAQVPKVRLNYSNVLLIRSQKHQVLVRTFGAPSSPPLLMIHGFKRTGRSFINLIPALSQQFFVIVPDLPGHGETLSVPLSIETSGSDSIADFSDMLGAIERVVEHFNLSSLAICGHSMGGVIASQFSIVHPERVSRLVLIESTPTYSWPKSTACDDCDEVMQFENAQAYVNTRIHGAELYERLWDQYVNQDFTRVFEVEGIPILWVMNTDGKVDAEHFTRLAESVSSRAMAHTTFIGFRRKGHFLQWTVPSEINKTMVEFLVQ